MNVGHIYDSHICMKVYFIYLLKKYIYMNLLCYDLNQNQN